MTDEEVLSRCRRIIHKNEKYGIKENMSRSHMIRVKTTVLADQEVADLKRIPKKLQIQGKKRKVTQKKRYSNDLSYFPKTGLEEVDKESSGTESRDETSNYS